MKTAKTRDLLIAYKKGGMRAVIQYVSNEELEFKEGTWVAKAKNLIEHNCWRSLEEEINLIIYKFSLNDDKIKEEPGGEDS